MKYLARRLAGVIKTQLFVFGEEDHHKQQNDDDGGIDPELNDEGEIEDEVDVVDMNGAHGMCGMIN